MYDLHGGAICYCYGGAICYCYDYEVVVYHTYKKLFLWRHWCVWPLITLEDEPGQDALNQWLVDGLRFALSAEFFLWPLTCFVMMSGGHADWPVGFFPCDVCLCLGHIVIWASFTWCCSLPVGGQLELHSASLHSIAWREHLLMSNREATPMTAWQSFYYISDDHAGYMTILLAMDALPS